MLKALFGVLLLVLVADTVFAQAYKWGDQHNGTYVNPVLPGDFDNIDVTRAGAEYFCVAATQNLSPGIVVLTSKDLVNWTIAGHVVDNLTRISAKYNYDKLQEAQPGISTCTIRFHDNKFYVYFTDPNDGIFMMTAARASGPWKMLSQLVKAPGWADACPVWDGNGQGYLMAANTAENKTHLFKLNTDGDQLQTGWDKTIDQGKATAGGRIYQIKDYYYHLYNQDTPEGRVPFMSRSVKIDGPYQQVQQLMHKADREPNQGGLVQTEKGEWYFLAQHNVAKWNGHEVSLLPVTWINDWPVLGSVARDGIGNMVTIGRKPVSTVTVSPIQTSDDFDGKSIAGQWEWYFQPNAEKWSCAERPGFLRLYASRQLEAGRMAKTPNILTQRTLRLPQSIATVKIDISRMIDGQMAGLSLFGKTDAALGIVQSGTSGHIYFSANDKVTEGPEITIYSVWLRAAWDANGLAHFFFSTDGVNYDPFGQPYTLTNFENGSGAKIGIYTYNNNNPGVGFIDVDWFHYGVN